MPIIGLTDRGASFPRIGELRKGGAKPATGNKPGADLKHFRFTSLAPEVEAQFNTVYGNQPTAVNCYLPFATAWENFDAWIEEWAAGGLKWRGDGKTLVMWQTADGKYSQEPKPQPTQGGKQVGRLKIIIPELGRLAYVTALTTSINDIMEMPSVLEAYQALRGDLRGIPFVLSRVPRMVSTPGSDGKRVRREKWLWHLEAQPVWVQAQLSVMQREALPSYTGAIEGQYQIAAGAIDIETGEIEDDDDYQEVVENAPQPSRAAEDVMTALLDAAGKNVSPANEKQLKFARASLSKLVNGSADSAKTILKYVFSVDSSSDLTGGEASAIIDWAGSKKENGYTPNPESVIEAAKIIKAAYMAEGQAPLFDELGEKPGAYDVEH